MNRPYFDSIDHNHPDLEFSEVQSVPPTIFYDRGRKITIGRNRQGCMLVESLDTKYHIKTVYYGRGRKPASSVKYLD